MLEIHDIWFKKKINVFRNNEYSLFKESLHPLCIYLFFAEKSRKKYLK